MRTVRLKRRDGTTRATAIVDDEDYDRVSRHGWCLNTTSGYAVANIKVDGRWRLISLHRFVLGLIPGDKKIVDHINRNRMDNRRENLRIVDLKVNARNTSSHRNARSQHLGVSWDNQTGKWRATAYVDGRYYSLGRFTEELEAAAVAHEFRRRHSPGFVP